MEGTEENSFEGKWKGAVDGAEVQPSGAVWSSVESALIAADNEKMRGLVVYYRRLAAASILFALFLGAMGYFYGRHGDVQDTTALNSAPFTEQGIPEQAVIPEVSGAENPSQKPKEEIKRLAVDDVVKKEMKQSRTRLEYLSVLSVPDSSRTAHAEVVDTLRANTAAQDYRASVTPELQRSGEGAVVESPIKIQKQKEETIQLPGLTQADEETVIDEHKKRKSSENVWASLGFAAGNYNPGVISSAPTASLGGPTSQGYVSKPGNGSAYSVGLTMGTRVSGRWVVQGGIHYLNQNSGYTSNINAFASNQPVAYDLYNVNVKPTMSVTYTNPYQINSTLEFVSVPVQAGYLIVDRKMGFQFNAGFAADFFIRNSLEDQSGQAKSYSQGAGSDSPYRSLNWAGLVSSELSYKLGRQYRISLVPGVRYLFNSALKSGATNNSYTADIGFRFRYILK